MRDAADNRPNDVNRREDRPLPELWAEIVRTATLVRSYTVRDDIAAKIGLGEDLTGDEVRALVEQCSDGRILADLVDQVDQMVVALGAGQVARREALRQAMGPRLVR